MAEAEKKLGNAALVAGNAELAVEHYSKAIELDGSMHALYSNRSAAYVKLANFEAALADGEKCIELKPDWGKAYSRKGVALEELGRKEEAIEAYEKGLEMEPGNETMQQRLQQLRKADEGLLALGSLFADPNLWTTLALNPDTSALVQDEEFRATVAEVQKQPQLLQQKLSEPKMLKAFQALMMARMQQAGMSQPQQQPQQQPKQEVKQEVKQQEVKQEEVKEEAKEVQEAKKEKERGNELYKGHQFQEALEAYEKAAELDPTDMTYLTNQASAHMALKQYEKAVKACKDAIDVGRTHRAHFEQIAKAYARIGSAHAKAGDLDAAIDAYKSSLTEHRVRQVQQTLRKLERQKEKAEREAYINPELAQEEKAKGNACFTKNDFPSAIKHYSEAMKRDPSVAAFYSNRAAAYMKLCEFRLGLDDCDKAIELDVTFVKAYKRKVTILLFLKEFHTAIATLQAAMRVAPGDAELQKSYQETMATAQSFRYKATPEEQEKRTAKVGQDPMIQELMRDDDIRQLLAASGKEGNPQAAQTLLTKPGVREKFDILLASGIIGLG